jgi:soluble lytic murein transglycosylase-like protein
MEVEMNSLLLNASRAFEALKSLLALVGVTALALFLILPLNTPLPEAAVQALVPPAEASAAGGASLPVLAVETPLEREQRTIAEYIAKRYRIADAAAAHFVAVAYRAADQHRLDALLVLAVMAIESRYNPVAESVRGARGLMQIIPRYHLEKLEPHGGEPVLLNPEVNIQVGAQILREYQRRFADTETALQMYAGALDEPTSRYANKVFAEKALLEALRIKPRKPGTAQAA